MKTNIIFSAPKKLHLNPAPRAKTRSARVHRIARLLFEHPDVRAAVSVVIPVAGLALFPARAAGERETQDGEYREEGDFHRVQSTTPGRNDKSRMTNRDLRGRTGGSRASGIRHHCRSRGVAVFKKWRIPFESAVAKHRARRNFTASQKITGAYWFRLKIRDADGMPRKPGWPRYQSWAKNIKAKNEELALAA